MKIICIGRNYIDHAKELNNPIPEEPIIFMKPPSALLMDNKPFYYPDFSNDIQYEAEIVLKMGKNGKHIQPEFAESYIESIALGIDFTARDLQLKCKEKGLPWEIAKGFDYSAALSQPLPWEVYKGRDIRFRLELNGKTVQEGSTGDLIFSFTDLICYISRYFKIQVGDLIYTGTPSGVGPVKREDRLTGYIRDQLMLTCQIK